MRQIPVLALNLFLAACATQPSAAPPVTGTEARDVPPAASAGSEAAAKVADASQTAKAPPGYKLARRNGELLYCKTEKQVGSNLPKQVCTTPEAYEDMERRMELDRENFRKNSTLCGTGGCGGT